MTLPLTGAAARETLAIARIELNDFHERYSIPELKNTGSSIKYSILFNACWPVFNSIQDILNIFKYTGPCGNIGTLYLEIAQYRPQKACTAYEQPGDAKIADKCRPGACKCQRDGQYM